MTSRGHPNRRPPDRLGEVISNASVRSYYEDILDHLGRFHEDVVVYRSDIDVRAEFADQLICRIVPYRELLHIQIGKSPTWEIRVRDEGSYMEAMGRILEFFLKAAARDGGAVGVRPARTNGFNPL